MSLGCAPTPIKLDQPPPSEKIGGSDAQITVVRTGIFALAVVFGVYVNDEHVGVLHTNDKVTVRVPAGEVKMFVGGEARSTAQFPARAGEAYYFRATPEMGWFFARPQLHVMEPKEAKPLLGELNDKTYPQPRPFPFDL